MNKKPIFKRIFIAGAVSTIAGFLYYRGLIAANDYLTGHSPKIETQAELDTIVQAERKDLNCNRDISAFLLPFDFSGTHKNYNGSFSVSIGGRRATHYNAYHETFHACDSYFNSVKLNNLYYLLWLEPRAIIHTVLHH